MGSAGLTVTIPTRPGLRTGLPSRNGSRRSTFSSTSSALATAGHRSSRAAQGRQRRNDTGDLLPESGLHALPDVHHVAAARLGGELLRPVLARRREADAVGVLV